jgi:hypothetical protein
MSQFKISLLVTTLLNESWSEGELSLKKASMNISRSESIYNRKTRTSTLETFHMFSLQWINLIEVQVDPDELSIRFTTRTNYPTILGSLLLKCENDDDYNKIVRLLDSEPGCRHVDWSYRTKDQDQRFNAFFKRSTLVPSP